MSTLIVEVCEVLAVEPHPNADRMKIATVKGWKTCIRYDPETGESQFVPGDRCVYFPPDAVMPEELAERLGITQYLAPLPKGPDGIRPPGLRVRAARLRGVPSYGVIMAATDDPSWQVGDDVADYYNITKYEPPERPSDGEAAPDHPAFHTYTEIENIANFPGVIKTGEEVVVTEKIHGKNCRVGLIRTTNEDGADEWVFMAGSHGLNRREYDAKGKQSDFWRPLNDGLRSLLTELSAGSSNVVAFGEIFGPGIQDMAYGQAKQGFRLFDIAVDGRYLDYDRKAEMCAKYGIEMVPFLYRGPFDEAKLADLTSGPTTLCEPDKAGKFKGREGVVVTPTVERIDLAAGRSGRVIFKSISVDYLARKGGTDAR